MSLDLSTEIIVTICVGVAIVVGFVGVVVPVLPGSLLIGAGILAWAIFVEGTPGRVLCGVALVVLIAIQVVQLLVAGRTVGAAGVGRITLLAGGVCALVGMFLIPVIGLPLGFIGGIYVAELFRSDREATAWHSTLAAVKAVGIGILIEICGVVLAVSLWIAALFSAFVF